jgi:hypothetical protein
MRLAWGLFPYSIVRDKFSMMFIVVTETRTVPIRILSIFSDPAVMFIMFPKYSHFQVPGAKVNRKSDRI